MYDTQATTSNKSKIEILSDITLLDRARHDKSVENSQLSNHRVQNNFEIYGRHINPSTSSNSRIPSLLNIQDSRGKQMCNMARTNATFDHQNRTFGIYQRNQNRQDWTNLNTRSFEPQDLVILDNCRNPKKVVWQRQELDVPTNPNRYIVI